MSFTVRGNWIGLRPYAADQKRDCKYTGQLCSDLRAVVLPAGLERRGRPPTGSGTVCVMAEYELDIDSASVSGPFEVHHLTVEVQGPWDPEWATAVLRESMEAQTIRRPKGCVIVHVDGQRGVPGGTLKAEYYKTPEGEVIQWLQDLADHAIAVKRR